MLTPSPAGARWPERQPLAIPGRFKVCQWAVPALTAGIAVLNVVEGEQQRPSQVVSGILAKPAQLLGIASGR